MSGILKGKAARIYDENVFATKDVRWNKFITRSIKPGLVVADFACGSGVSVEYLKDRVSKLYAIDASEDMITLARQRFRDVQNVEFIVSDIRKTPLENESLDQVLIRMSLHHIQDKEAVMQEIFRVLKKGGQVVLVDKFRRFDPLSTWVYDTLRNLKRNYHIFGHHYCTYQKFLNMIKDQFVIEYEFIHAKEIYLKANLILRKVWMKKVMVFGTFDIFHKGHESYLKQAREHGDHLIAVVALDETVKELKGALPENKQNVRLKRVKDSGLTDEVVLGNKEDRYRVLKDYQPDVICLGYDQKGFADYLEEVLPKLGLTKTKLVRLEPYRPDIYKSSKLK